MPETSPPGTASPVAESEDTLNKEHDGVEEPRTARQRAGDRLTIAAGLMIVAVLTGLVTWTGYRAYV